VQINIVVADMSTLTGGPIAHKGRMARRAGSGDSHGHSGPRDICGDLVLKLFDGAWAPGVGTGGPAKLPFYAPASSVDVPNFFWLTQHFLKTRATLDKRDLQGDLGNRQPVNGAAGSAEGGPPPSESSGGSVLVDQYRPSGAMGRTAQIQG
jgi:hypothetical protein